MDLKIIRQRERLADKAQRLVDDGRVHFWARIDNRILWVYVEGDTGTHQVFLPAGEKAICTCHAGTAKRQCSHIRAAIKAQQIVRAWRQP